MKKGQKGFTLVELLLVIAIIGILAAIAVPRFQDARGDAAAASCLANQRLVADAIQRYNAQEASAYSATTATAAEAALVPDYLTSIEDTCPGGGTLTWTANGVTCTVHAP